MDNMVTLDNISRTWQYRDMDIVFLGSFLDILQTERRQQSCCTYHHKVTHLSNFKLQRCHADGFFIMKNTKISIILKATCCNVLTCTCKACMPHPLLGAYKRHVLGVSLQPRTCPFIGCVCPI